MQKALIAMSGGVDSSVAAHLMKNKGYDCIGCTMKLYSNEDAGVEKSKTCCTADDADDARSVAARLGIPFYVFNFTDLFREKVICRFADCYERGITPNPCIDCNRYMKFEKLIERADEGVSLLDVINKECHLPRCMSKTFNAARQNDEVEAKLAEIIETNIKR